MNQVRPPAGTATRTNGTTVDPELAALARRREFKLDDRTRMERTHSIRITEDPNTHYAELRELRRLVKDQGGHSTQTIRMLCELASTRTLSDCDVGGMPISNENLTAASMARDDLKKELRTCEDINITWLGLVLMTRVGGGHEFILGIAKDSEMPEAVRIRALQAAHVATPLDSSELKEVIATIKQFSSETGPIGEEAKKLLRLMVEKTRSIAIQLGFMVSNAPGHVLEPTQGWP